MPDSNLTEDQLNPLVKHAYACSEPHLSGYRLVIGFETLEQAQAAHRYVAKLANDYVKKQAPRCTCADFDGFVDCPVHI